MDNDKIVAYVFLILTLVAICCHTRAKDEYWQDIRLQKEGQSSLLRSLEEFVNKRGCGNPGDTCDTSSDCCGGNNGCVGCAAKGTLCTLFGIACIGTLGRRVCYYRDGAVNY